MEVMHRAVIKSRALKPLPSEITNERINGAILPVHIEAARTAIALCTSLPELLKYKSQAEGLAAAVRTMKEVGPEMIRAANEMMADAWRKGGELLSQYSGKSIVERTPKGNNIIKNHRSPRRVIAESMGLKSHDADAMVRLSKASESQVYSAVKLSRNVRLAAQRVPAVNATAQMRASLSDSLRPIMRHLSVARWESEQISLESVKQLTPDERKVVKGKITEIMELLDEMDRLCR